MMNGTETAMKVGHYLGLDGKALRTGLIATLLVIAAPCLLTAGAAEPTQAHASIPREPMLSPKQQAIGPIAAFAATGDMDRLHIALERGLDAGLTISDCKEVIVQLYAYAGFPRSLNALTRLMQVLDERKGRGLVDQEGNDSGLVPVGDELLAVGTANQTKLTGAPVKGAVFDFSPVIDRYLKTHLFGDIFARTNLDWQSREVATVAALAAMNGLEAQLRSHMRASMNIGLDASKLRHLVDVLARDVGADAARRAAAALDKQLETMPR